MVLGYIYSPDHASQCFEEIIINAKPNINKQLIIKQLLSAD